MDLLVLGIDSLDPYFIDEWQEHLPVLCKIMSQNVRYDVTCPSDYPANSPTGWASIYSGCSAAEHGVTAWHYQTDNADDWLGIAKHLPTRWWDTLQEQGATVGLMCPPMVWAPKMKPGSWCVSGFPTPFMAQYQHRARAAIVLDSTPEHYTQELYSSSALAELVPWGHVVDAKDTYDRLMETDDWLSGEYVDRIEVLPMSRLEFALRAQQALPVDCMFIFWGYLDRLCHAMNYLTWRHEVQEPEETKQQLFWAYKKMDRTIGLALDAFEPRRFIICSDHGHNFSTVSPAQGMEGKVSGDERFIGHTWKTIGFTDGGPAGRGQGTVGWPYREILRTFHLQPREEAIIQAKLRDLGYIE